jgi:transposase
VSAESDTQSERARIEELERMLASERAGHAEQRASFEARIADLTRERDVLRHSHARLREELELLKKRLFVAKAERIDTRQLELEFAAKLRALEEVAGTLGLREESAEDAPSDTPKDRKDAKDKASPKGRRTLRDLPIEEETIEINDPALEALVEEGKLSRHGFEESVRLRRLRGGLRRVVIRRVKYRATDAHQGEDAINAETGALAVYTTPMPPTLFARSLATPSLVAWIATRKFAGGMPLFRIEDELAREGVPIDRGSMSRWLEHAGSSLGATVVHAMRAHALRTAFCIATDATGFAIQPVRTHEKVRKPCRKGHYLVLVADRDHILFEYLERETSAAISEVFRGYAGYVQADAKSVFDALFEPPRDAVDTARRAEVGCWSHARRKFWDATADKSAIAREGLARIGRIFELDAHWRGKPPAEIKRLRDAHLRAHVESFFAWVAEEYRDGALPRSSLRSALGYAHRQREPLSRFLDDGRLVLDNNRSERALRSVAVGRKAWLFAGSDDHATSASHFFTLVASAKLHGLDPEAYLRDLLRVLPHWPRDRYLELAPLYWAETRARIDAAELERELGPMNVPAVLPSSVERPAAEQPSPD